MGRSLIIAGHYQHPPQVMAPIPREIVRALDKLGIHVQLLDLPTGSLGHYLREAQLLHGYTKPSGHSSAILHICLPQQARIVEEEYQRQLHDLRNDAHSRNLGKASALCFTIFIVLPAPII